MFIGLALALVLGVLIPGVVLAAKPDPFEATGTVTYLEAGDVFPAGDSGRWVVASRYLEGTFVDGIPGDFSMTYKANVTSEQAGNLHGTLERGPYVLKVNGKSEPADVLDYVVISPGIVVPTKLGLALSGRWTFIEGAQGNGGFDAYVVFTPWFDEEGNMHVGPVIPDESSFDLTGKWQE